MRNAIAIFRHSVGSNSDDVENNIDAIRTNRPIKRVLVRGAVRTRGDRKTIKSAKIRKPRVTPNIIFQYSVRCGSRTIKYKACFILKVSLTWLS